MVLSLIPFLIPILLAAAGAVAFLRPEQALRAAPVAGLEIGRAHV